MPLKKSSYTVDGRNPAPPVIYETLYENWDKLPYQLVSLPHSFQQQYHACLGASRSVLAFGAFCTTPFGHRAIGDPKPDRRRWGKRKHDGISQVFFGGVKTNRGMFFFFGVFYWLVGLKRFFFQSKWQLLMEEF